MSIDTSISRRELITSMAVSAPGLLIPNSTSAGTKAAEEDLSTSADKVILTPEEYVEAARINSQKSGVNKKVWQTCTMNSSGEIVVLKTYDSIDEALENYDSPAIRDLIEESGIIIPSGTEGDYVVEGGVTLSVIGGLLLGYVFGTVVDGIVITVTGNSAAYWFAQAVSKVLWNPLPALNRIYIDCTLYSGTDYYLQCRFGVH